MHESSYLYIVPTITVRARVQILRYMVLIYLKIEISTGAAFFSYPIWKRSCIFFKQTDSCPVSDGVLQSTGPSPSLWTPKPSPSSCKSGLETGLHFESGLESACGLESFNTASMQLTYNLTQASEKKGNFYLLSLHQTFNIMINFQQPSIGVKKCNCIVTVLNEDKINLSPHLCFRWKEQNGVYVGTMLPTQPCQ